MAGYFPDQSHVSKIAKSLWGGAEGRPGAALMVGSGMSRNGLLHPLTASGMPDWATLATHLIEELYPQSNEDSQRQRDRAHRMVNATSGMLRLAEEYEATHGRLALNNFLLRHVPDSGVSPGQQHEELLKLPWRDVLTTNWDRLLERTADKVAFMRYNTVTQIGEIARATPPRIVKLHGSFPNIEPFIFTEEDFRTYPQKFAPFVNLVRQTMMENVLCLIGFSGDDPNFLQWLGWVRDELGSRAPQVYLCGWLDLPSGQRKLLESLHLIPVDYARHPGLRAEVGTKYRAAVEQFIDDLCLEQPSNPRNWPKRHIPRPIFRPCDGSSADINVDTQPHGNERLSYIIPLFESKINKDIKNRRREFECITEQLSDKRKNYRGYISLNNKFKPNNEASAKKFANNYVENLYELVASFVKNETNKFRLFINFIYEIYWICCISHFSIENKFFDVIEERFGAPDDVNKAGKSDLELEPRWFRGADGHRDPIPLPFSEVRERMIALWLGVARSHRERILDDPGDTATSRFETWTTALLAIDGQERGHHEEVYFQSCLHGLYTLDIAAIDDAIAEWEADADGMILRDPYWAIRQAGILTELGRFDRARRLTKKAFSALRRQTDANAHEALTSREIWTIHFLTEFLGVNESESGWWQSRLSQISTPEIDAASEISARQAAFIADIRLRRNPYADADDDLKKKAIDEASSFIGFVEHIGFPPHGHEKGGFRKVLADEILAAANRLTAVAPGRSLAAALRACANAGDVSRIDVLKEGCLDLSPELAAAWAGRLATQLPRLLDRLQALTSPVAGGLRQDQRGEIAYILGRVAVALAALERLAGKSPKAASFAFDAAIACHRHPALARQVSLYRPLGKLFDAAQAKGGVADLHTAIVKALECPLPGIDSFKPASLGRWPDPFQSLSAVTISPAPAPPDGGNAARILLAHAARLAAPPAQGEFVRRRLAVLKSAGWVPADIAAQVDDILPPPPTAT